MKNLLRSVVAALAATLVAVSLATAANAATATSFTLSSNSVTGGTTITATASFEYNAAAPADEVGLRLPPALVGVAQWQTISSTPSRGCFAESPAGDAACLWNSASIGETITIEATLFVPAGTSLGSYTITTFSGQTPTDLTQTLTVTDAQPVLDPIGTQTVAENATEVVTITASDPDGTPVTFVPISLPSFATFVDNGDDTATLTLAPDFTDAGTYSATIALTGAIGSPTPPSETFDIVVTNTDRNPVLDPIGTQTVAEGATQNVTLTASDPDGDPITFVDISLPSFASLTDNGDGTATLTLAPGFTDAGTTSATIALAGAVGAPTPPSETFDIVVTNTNRAPALPLIGSQTVAEGTTSAFSLTASDPDGDALTFLPSSLPAWVSYVDDGAGTVTFTLSPTASDIGQVTIRVLVTDGDLDAIEDVLITVVDPTSPTIIGPGPITAEAQGPAGAPVIFSVVAEDLADGPLTPTCTPASGSTFALGTTTVTCTATDSDSNVGTGTFEITVVDTTAPRLTAAGGAPLAAVTVTDASPSGATVTFAPEATDLVDGAVTPVCTPASGSVFPVGDTVVTCTATDAAGNTATEGFTVSVVAAVTPDAGGGTDGTDGSSGPGAGGVTDGTDGSPAGGGSGPALASTGASLPPSLVAFVLLLLAGGAALVRQGRAAVR